MAVTRGVSGNEKKVKRGFSPQGPVLKKNKCRLDDHGDCAMSKARYSYTTTCAIIYLGELVAMPPANLRLRSLRQAAQLNHVKNVTNECFVAKH